MLTNNETKCKRAIGAAKKKKKETDKVKVGGTDGNEAQKEARAA